MRNFFFALTILALCLPALATTADEYVQSALAKQKAGDFDGAIADYNKAIKLKPDLGTYLNRSWAKGAKFDYAGAIDDLDFIIERRPEYAPAYSNRAFYKARQEKQEDAIADYNKAIQLDPQRAGDYSARGMIKAELADFPGALADMDKAVELQPDQPESYSDRYQVKRIVGDLDSALMDCNKVIELLPGSPRGYTDRAMLMRDKGDLDAALADCDKALKLDPLCVAAFNVRAHVKQAKGDYAGELEDFTRAVEASHGTPHSIFERATAYYEQHAWKEAIADYRKVLQIAPAHPYAPIGIFLARAALGEREAAATELRQLLKRRNPPAGDWPAKIAAFVAGDLSEADFLKAADHSSKKIANDRHCEAWFYAGAIQLLDGNKTAAAEDFKKSLETQATNFTEYFFAAAELKRLHSAK